MTDAMLKEWLAQYNRLEEKSDRYWKKMIKHEKAGDIERLEFYSNRMDETEAERRGMLKALEIFGYTIVYQDDDIKVVHNS